jgi:hypothetical protein
MPLGLVFVMVFFFFRGLSNYLKGSAENKEAVLGSVSREIYTPTPGDGLSPGEAVMGAMSGVSSVGAVTPTPYDYVAVVATEIISTPTPFMQGMPILAGSDADKLRSTEAAVVPTEYIPVPTKSLYLGPGGGSSGGGSGGGASDTVKDSVQSQLKTSTKKDLVSKNKPQLLMWQPGVLVTVEEFIQLCQSEGFRYENQGGIHVCDCPSSEYACYQE